MKAVVLAGGLRSGEEIAGVGLPRALWPFPSQPLIAHVIGFLKTTGCTEIAICANGKTPLIAAELAAGNYPALQGITLHYSQDPLPRGPAGCLRDLQEWLGTDTFLAIQATGSFDFDLSAMLQEHRRTHAAITVGARRCPDDVDLLEPAGVYLVEPSALPLIQPQGYQDFKEQFIPKVVAAGMRVRCHCLKGSATLIHSPGHYLAALRNAIGAAALHPPGGFRTVAGGAIVHETATVDSSARLNGPIWIAHNAVVEARAVLAGPVVLGPGARIGAGALLHRTVAMKHTIVAPGAEVFSAILPPDTLRSARTAPLSRGGRPAVHSSARQDTGWPSMRAWSDRLLTMFDGRRPNSTAP